MSNLPPLAAGFALGLATALDGGEDCGAPDTVAGADVAADEEAGGETADDPQALKSASTPTDATRRS